MTPAPLVWVAGAVASVALNGVLVGLVLWSIQPSPLDEQTLPETQMTLTTHQVRQSEAAELAAETIATETEDTAGAQMRQGAVPQTKAKAVEANQPVVKAKPVISAKVDPVANPARPAQILAAKPDSAVQLAQPAQSVTPINPSPILVASTGLSAPLVASTPPEVDRADAVPTQTIPISQTQPKATRAKAADVFSASGGGAIDPVSLAAFQSFVSPVEGGQAAQALRDGVDGVLAAVPCARLQVQFQPEANTLEVIGHIPEDAMRAPVLAALQAKMGQNIRVADNIRILPRPQCGTLSGLSDVDLPQSTDQITNPLLLGDDVHAREFHFVAGDQLILDLTGADYDAYIYVDYFDAGGQVVHLSPNADVPLTLVPAGRDLKIGAQTPDDPGLYVTIGPPYGQEIAVAFAASVPLFDEIRPLIEPAEPYLELLESRVAALRAETPDFKGEWVYFYISTSETR